MAYLTFHPSTERLQESLVQQKGNIAANLRMWLPRLGVAPNDIVFRIEKCITVSASEEHVEVILKTDNAKVTAPEVVTILNEVLHVPFEVTRIPVGYGVSELAHEILAFVMRKRRNWASNYEQS